MVGALINNANRPTRAVGNSGPNTSCSSLELEAHIALADAETECSWHRCLVIWHRFQLVEQAGAQRIFVPKQPMRWAGEQRRSSEREGKTCKGGENVWFDHELLASSSA